MNSLCETNVSNYRGFADISCTVHALVYAISTVHTSVQANRVGRTTTHREPLVSRLRPVLGSVEGEVSSRTGLTVIGVSWVLPSTRTRF